MQPIIEFTLVATLHALGPYPVAIRSYADPEQCFYAAELLKRDGTGYGVCPRIVVPMIVKQR